MAHYPKLIPAKVPGRGVFSKRESHEPGTLHGQTFTKVGTQVGYVKPMPGFQSSPYGGRPSSNLAFRFVNSKRR